MLNQQGHPYQPELRVSQQIYLDGTFSYVLILILCMAYKPICDFVWVHVR